MTALALIHAGTEVVIASDGAWYNPDDGALMKIESKVLRLPEWKCVMAQRGGGGFMRGLYEWGLEAAATDFDSLLLIIERTMKLGFPLFALSRGVDDVSARVSLFLAGWSESRSKLEIYMIRTHKFQDYEPFNLYPIDGIYAAPFAPTDVIEAFGIDMSAPKIVGVECGVRLVCAARAGWHRMPLDEFETEATKVRCGVGGFIEVTRLFQTGESRTDVVHEWPDKLGEAINPDVGEAMPQWLMARPAD